MYFIPIMVPIFVEGDRKFVHSDWKRALLLLRDSLEGRYGELRVAAPWLPVEDARAGEQVLEAIDAHEGIELQPLYDWRVRARFFWLHEFKRIRSELELSLARARVVHGTLDDLFRPMTDAAVIAALRRNLPTIVVQDTDVVIRSGSCRGEVERCAREMPRTRSYTRAWDATWWLTPICHCSRARS